MSLHRIRTAVASVLAVGLFAATPTSNAQFGGQAGFADAFRIGFLERDLPLFVQTLKLEEWQRPIVESLLQSYQADFTVGVEEVRDEMRKMTERIATTREDQVMSMILEPLDGWNRARTQLRMEFLTNVKAQLSSEQLSNWPHFERTLRRDKSLPKGELMGESIDLFLVSRNLRMPYEVQESLDPIMMEYEVSLDLSLDARDTRIDSLQDQIKDAMASMDFELGLSAMDQIMSARVRVREVQDEYLLRITELLPAEWSETFEETAMKKAYPKVYRPTPIEQLLKTVRSIPTLTSEQRMQLDAIEADFDLQRGALEMRLLHAYRQHEPGEPRRRVQAMLDRREGNARQSRSATPMDTIAAERNDLVAETRRRILAVLNPEQIGDMPSSGQAKKNGLRPRNPNAAVPAGSIATPSGRHRTSPKFGDSATGGADKRERVDPSSRGGDKNRSRGDGRNN
jgi:Spy/CpxP family protein refolding chaperone